MTYRAEYWNISLLELWFCCVDNHWPYSKSAKAIQTALNRQIPHNTQSTAHTDALRAHAEQATSIVVIEKIQRNQSERIWRNNLHRFQSFINTQRGERKGSVDTTGT